MRVEEIGADVFTTQLGTSDFRDHNGSSNNLGGRLCGQ